MAKQNGCRIKTMEIENGMVVGAAREWDKMQHRNDLEQIPEVQQFGLYLEDRFGGAIAELMKVPEILDAVKGITGAGF